MLLAANTWGFAHNKCRAGVFATAVASTAAVLVASLLQPVGRLAYRPSRSTASVVAVARWCALLRAGARRCALVRAVTINDYDALDLARAFAALADPARLRLLSLIATAPSGEACACDLIEPIGKHQPTVSHHLRVLHDAGLIDREKRGIWMWFRANPTKLEQLRAVLG